MRSELSSVPSVWDVVLTVGGGSLVCGSCLHLWQPSRKKGGQDLVSVLIEAALGVLIDREMGLWRTGEEAELVLLLPPPPSIHAIALTACLGVIKVLFLIRFWSTTHSLCHMRPHTYHCCASGSSSSCASSNLVIPGLSKLQTYQSSERNQFSWLFKNRGHELIHSFHLLFPTVSCGLSTGGISVMVATRLQKGRNSKLERDLQAEISNANTYSSVCPRLLPGTTCCIPPSACFPTAPLYSANVSSLNRAAAVANPYIQRTLGAPGPVLTGMHV